MCTCTSFKEDFSPYLGERTALNIKCLSVHWVFWYLYIINVRICHGQTEHCKFFTNSTRLTIYLYLHGLYYKCFLYIIPVNPLNRGHAVCPLMRGCHFSWKSYFGGINLAHVGMFFLQHPLPKGSFIESSTVHV